MEIGTTEIAEYNFKVLGRANIHTHAKDRIDFFKKFHAIVLIGYL